MPSVFDSNIDLSNVAGSFNPAVTAGLTTFALLGKSLQASLNNYAAPASPLLTSSSGNGFPAIASGMSGATVNGIGQLLLPDAPSTDSETIFIVASINPSNWATFNMSPVGIWNGTAGSLTQACYMNAQSTLTGVQFNVGYINGSGMAVTAGMAVRVNAGTLGTTPPEQAIVSTPQCYMMKFDIPNLLATFKNVTQASLIGAPAATTSTLVLTSGSTRPVITSNYELMGNIQSPVNAASTIHAFVRYDRATPVSEDALIYAQLQKVMATRGFTI
ncbi:hypothetical protein [Granulicella mallensis]|uniref:Uncharacterized protein n=1 Tax=Granulicella mallensis (strain ATCC BAA-1857 / DSM 23137 / MP5ACTX8) TaxID=682795 RepID=G8NQP2_GRAMM|nr:hypothetical protein [Granulicella mallensis]AEU37268.1 hypothetical protein AciX8_2965 [Granulicella mallensis MP5ACTX8]